MCKVLGQGLQVLCPLVVTGATLTLRYLALHVRLLAVVVGVLLLPAAGDSTTNSPRLVAEGLRDHLFYRSTHLHLSWRLLEAIVCESITLVRAFHRRDRSLGIGHNSRLQPTLLLLAILPDITLDQVLLGLILGLDLGQEVNILAYWVYGLVDAAAG